MNIQFQTNATNNIIESKTMDTSFLQQNLKKEEPTYFQDAYKVTISEEGYESCKTFSKESREDTEAILEKEKVDRFHERYNELGAKVIVDIDGLTNSIFYSKFLGPDAKSEYGEDFTPERMIQDCMDTYTSMYDEIKKGYADGTREMWVLDSTAEDGFRKITEEEELAALDKTFDFHSMVTDNFLTRGMYESEIVSEIVGRFRAMMERRPYEDTVERAPRHNITDIQNKLKDAAKSFREMYAVNTNNTSLFSKQAIKNTFNIVVK